VHATKAQWGVEVQRYFVTSVLHGGEQSDSRPSCCNPWGRASSNSWVCLWTCLKT